MQNLDPLLLPQILREALNDTMEQTLDLTGFSTANISNSTEDNVEITIKGIGRTKAIKIEKNTTTLQLAFSSFADILNADPSSFLFIFNGRRISHDAEETAAQYGICNGDTVHALQKKMPNEQSSTPEQGRIVVFLLEVGKEDKEFFRVDVNLRLSKIVSECVMVFFLSLLIFLFVTLI